MVVGVVKQFRNVCSQDTLSGCIWAGISLQKMTIFIVRGSDEIAATVICNDTVLMNNVCWCFIGRYFLIISKIMLVDKAFNPKVLVVDIGKVSWIVSECCQANALLLRVWP